MEPDLVIETHEVEGTLGWSEVIVRESMKNGNYSYETLFVDWENDCFEWRANFGPHHAEIWRVSFFGLEGCELLDTMQGADRDIHIFRFPTGNPVKVYEALVREMRELQYDMYDPDHPDHAKLQEMERVYRHDEQ